MPSQYETSIGPDCRRLKNRERQRRYRARKREKELQSQAIKEDPSENGGPKPSKDESERALHVERVDARHVNHAIETRTMFFESETAITQTSQHLLDTDDGTDLPGVMECSKILLELMNHTQHDGEQTSVCRENGTSKVPELGNQHLEVGHQSVRDASVDVRPCTTRPFKWKEEARRAAKLRHEASTASQREKCFQNEENKFAAFLSLSLSAPSYMNVQSGLPSCTLKNDVNLDQRVIGLSPGRCNWKTAARNRVTTTTRLFGQNL